MKNYIFKTYQRNESRYGMGGPTKSSYQIVMAHNEDEARAIAQIIYNEFRAVVKEFTPEVAKKIESEQSYAKHIFFKSEIGEW